MADDWNFDLNNNILLDEEDWDKPLSDEVYRNFSVYEPYVLIPGGGLDPENNSSDEQFFYYIIAPRRHMRMASPRSTQLKNLRDATRSLKDRLSDGDGMFDGTDDGEILWYIAQVEDILSQYSETGLREEDRCTLMVNCMTGNAKQVVNAAKMTMALLVVAVVVCCVCSQT